MRNRTGDDRQASAGGRNGTNGALAHGDVFMFRVALFTAELLENDAGLSGEDGRSPAAEAPKDSRESGPTSAIARFGDALRLAAPVLVGEQPEAGDSPKRRRWRAAVHRYMMRAVTRPTPFGLFSAVGLGRIGRAGASVPILQFDPERCVRVLEVDAQAAHLLRRRVYDTMDAARRVLKCNPTLYKSRTGLRFYHFGSGRRFALFGLETEPHVVAAVSAAASGAPAENIIASVASVSTDTSRSDAEQIVALLCANGVLIDALTPGAVGETLSMTLQRTADKLDAGDAVRVQVSKVLQMLSQQQAAPVGSLRKELGAIEAALETVIAPGIAGGSERGARTPPQRASEHYVNCTAYVEDEILELSADEMDRTARVMEVLWRHNFQGGGEGARLVRAFVERFDDEDVPLPIVVDPDDGISVREVSGIQRMPSPLVDLLDRGSQEFGEAPSGDRHDAWLTDRLMEWGGRAGEAVMLASGDLLGGDDAPDLPAGITAHMRLQQDGTEARQYDLLGSFGGSPLALLGRFGHVLNPRDLIRLRACAEREQDACPETLAQVSAPFPGRLGNIACQPWLRRVVLACDWVDLPGTITVVPWQEVLVSISPQRVILTWRRTGTVLRPRIDHPVNTGLPELLPVVRFLAAVQAQEYRSHCGWSWGGLRLMRHLPEVRIDGIRVAHETWKYGRSDLQDLEMRAGDVVEGGRPDRMAGLIRNVAERDGWGSRVGIGSASEHLAFDLRDEMQASQALSLFLRERRVLRLPEGESPGVASASGRHSVEVAVPFFGRRIQSSHGRQTSHRLDSLDGTGADLEGRLKDGVVYIKCYASEHAIDRSILPGLSEMEERCDGLRDQAKWHFVRYEDRRTHCRVRWFCRSEDAAIALMRMVERERNDGRLRAADAVVYDGYKPEYARYGGGLGMAIAEQMFYADSRSVCTILRDLVLEDESTEEDSLGQARARWIVAGWSMWRWLAAWGLNASEVQRFLVEHVAWIGSGGRVARAEERRINDFYRRNRLRIERWASGEPLDDTRVATRIVETLQHRDEEVRRCSRRYAGVVVDEERRRILHSLIHMHANRLLSGQPRRQELALTLLMERLAYSLTRRR